MNAPRYVTKTYQVVAASIKKLGVQQKKKIEQAVAEAVEVREQVAVEDKVMRDCAKLCEVTKHFLDALADIKSKIVTMKTFVEKMGEPAKSSGNGGAGKCLLRSGRNRGGGGPPVLHENHHHHPHRHHHQHGVV